MTRRSTDQPRITRYHHLPRPWFKRPGELDAVGSVVLGACVIGLFWLASILFLFR